MKLSLKGSGLPLKLTLVFLSVILTMVGVEIAYRFYLNYQNNSAYEASIAAALAYTVYNDSIVEYNREFGYSYVANETFFTVRVENGYPVACNERSVNKYGNTSRIKGVYEEADLRILVFGDSFTATQQNGLTWPDLLQDKLEEKLSKSIHIINFGRDGYGILQMFDLAAAKIEDLKPDLVIIAFISDDLNRARFWRTVNYINGEKRVFTTTEPSEKVDLKTSTDTVMLNPSVTKEWYESMLSSYKPDDLLLAELNDQFRRLKKENDLIKVNFASVSTSFLLNRISHGNALYGFIKPSRNPRLTISDFAADPRFVQNVASMNQGDASYYVVHLPEYREIKGRGYLFNSQQEALLQSLQEITNREIIRLLEYTGSIYNLEKLFLLPYDTHPSYHGLEFYAEAISQAIFSEE